MNQVSNWTAVGAVLLMTLAAPVLPVQAQPSAYQRVDRAQATTRAVPVQVAPGRATAISFSQTEETIAYILLADASRLVYSTDAELETGQAQTVFLRVIAPLHFPGATTAPVTNLMIQTVDPRGQQRLYTFDIVHSGNPRYVGVQIVPAIASAQTSPLADSLHLTPNHIQMGLRIALRRGYTAIDDLVVAQVQQLLQLTQMENLKVAEAAQSVGIPLDVLAALQSLATTAVEP